MFANFRLLQRESRDNMRSKDAETLRKLEDAETKDSKPIWVLIRDWSPALNHMAPERPTGAGQIFRRPEQDELAKKARIA